MKPEERVDLDIAAKLMQSHGLTPKRFTKAERRKGKTADFRVMRGENLLAFCEVKSPQDDWAMSLSLLKFVGQASLVDDAMLPS